MPASVRSSEDALTLGQDDRESSLIGDIDLQHYLRVVRKHKWPIVLFTALITGLAAYYAYTATPIYRATSTLLIESQKANVVSIEDLIGVETESADYYQTQFELLKSRQLAARVVSVMNLVDHPELSGARDASDTTASAGQTGSELAGSAQPTEVASGDNNTSSLQVESGESAGFLASMTNRFKALLDISEDKFSADSKAVAGGTGNNSTNNLTLDNPAITPSGDSRLDAREHQVIDRFMSRLSVNPVRKTKLVKISFESSDPAFAAEVANTVGEQYILAYLDSRMDMANKVSTWMNDRILALKDKLDVSEANLQAFKQANGLVDVNGSVSRVNEQELILATTELAQARSELADASNLRREIRLLGGNIRLLEAIPEVQADALVSSIKLDIGKQQRELDELSTRYGPRHPKIVDANSRVASLEATLEKQINRVVSRIEKDYSLLSARVASIQSQLSRGKQDIQDIGSKKFELDALEREVQTNRNLYETYYNQMAEAESAEGIDVANARIADFAIMPAQPFKPKKQLIIALAALASLALAVLMAILYETMDETIKSTEDVEDKLGVKLLGILPLIKGGLLSGKKELPLNPVDVQDKKGTFFEAVNTVRTAVSLDSKADQSNKVILITSSVPGEGKSTTAMNLAYSFSQLEKVVLIDCDMRRPSIAKSLSLGKDQPGLSNLLTKTAKASDCLLKGAIGDLDVITAGPMSDQPLELLSSGRFALIVEQLSRHYDRIILDCAPTQAVSDALVLSKLSDFVIYAVKSHATPIQLVNRGLQRLRQVNAPIAGVLMTQVDIDRIVSYGGDYYYQGYYDYYGYNDTGNKSKRKIKLTNEQLEDLRHDTDGIEMNLDREAGRYANGHGYPSDESRPQRSVRAKTQRETERTLVGETVSAAQPRRDDVRNGSSIEYAAAPNTQPKNGQNGHHVESQVAQVVETSFGGENNGYHERATMRQQTQRPRDTARFSDDLDII